MQDKSYPYQQFFLQKGNKSKKIKSSFHLFPVFYSDLDYLHYKSGEKRVKKLPFWMIFLSYGLALNLLNNSKQKKIICIGLFHSFWAIQPDHTPKNSSAPSTSSQHSPQALLPTCSQIKKGSKATFRMALNPYSLLLFLYSFIRQCFKFLAFLKLYNMKKETIVQIAPSTTSTIPVFIFFWLFSLLISISFLLSKKI